jgi:hypothetical protein
MHETFRGVERLFSEDVDAITERQSFLLDVFFIAKQASDPNDHLVVIHGSGFVIGGLNVFGTNPAKAS